MTRVRSSLLAGFAAAAAVTLMALAPATVLAQVGPQGPDFKKDVGMATDRDADNAKVAIDSYNSFSKTKGPYVPISPEDQVLLMGPGINFIGGYDPYWDGKPTKIRAFHFAKIKAAGFSTIRVPLFAFSHLQADGHLDAEYFKKIDWVVGQAIKNNLNVILDEHDFEICAKDSNACADKLANVWYELSDHYKDAPNNVIFELLNEPNGQVDDKIWNAWLIDLLAIVRETNPTRNVIIGPTHWNSRDDLKLLGLPVKDQHIIVTFHYYDPFKFTHQGASWAGPDMEKLQGVRWEGKPEEVAAIKADFDKVLAWSIVAKRPIFLGEFGAYDRYGLPGDRAAWTATVAAEAKRHGFASAYWYFDGSFAAYDVDKNKWIDPIKDALLPKQ